MLDSIGICLIDFPFNLLSLLRSHEVLKVVRIVAAKIVFIGLYLEEILNLIQKGLDAAQSINSVITDTLEWAFFLTLSSCLFFLLLLLGIKQLTECYWKVVMDVIKLHKSADFQTITVLIICCIPSASLLSFQGGAPLWRFICHRILTVHINILGSPIEVLWLASPWLILVLEGIESVFIGRSHGFIYTGF